MSDLLGYGDGYQLAQVITDLCDRVKTMNKIAPGTEAKWVLGVDDTDFEIVIRVKGKRKVD